MRVILTLAVCTVLCLNTIAQLPQLSAADPASPIFLRSLQVTVNVIGNKATTTFTMVFHNPSERTLEGNFVFPLPDGAVVSRYALDVNGKMREGVPVEKERATQVFEAVERRRIDPGLLEKTEGNNFRTRIYPVPARGDRSIVVGFEQELFLDQSGELVYDLPLASEGEIQQVSFALSVLHNGAAPALDKAPLNDLVFSKANEGYAASARGENLRLQQALRFRIPKDRETPDVFVQHNGSQPVFYVHTALPQQVKEKQLPRKLALVWDASLSGLYRDTAKELALLERYLHRCQTVSVQLYTLRHHFRPAGIFKIRKGDAQALLRRLRTLAYDGGTDYAGIRLPVVDEVLLFSDGNSTLSDAPFPSPNAPVYTVSSSSRSNDNRLRTMAEENGGAFINLKILSEHQALEKLTKSSLFFWGVKGGGKALQHFPTVKTPVDAGFTLAGFYDGNPVTLRLGFGNGRRQTQEKIIHLPGESAAVSVAWNLGRLVAQKQLAVLEKDEEANKAAILRLAREHSLVTRFTSLLVLETVQDYVRYGIQPPAELLEEYNRLLEEKRSEITERKAETLENALTSSDKLWTWWQTRFLPWTKPVERLTTAHVATDAGSLRVVQSSVSFHSPVIKRDEEVIGDAPPVQEETERRLLTGSVTGVQLSDVVVVGYSTRHVTVRGQASMNAAAQPLVVVDGEVNGVVPPTEQIQSVEAMSETAGVSLYGAKAVNGVLLISTKGGHGRSDGETRERPEITVEERAVDAAYLRILARTPRQQQYRQYLRLREQNLLNPTFYFDMANFFFKRDRATGLQVLTNLCELDFQNHELLKLFGFKLQELGETRLAEFVFKTILRWRPQEPQSYRDYALALADNRKYQQALNTLYAALANEYTTDVMEKYEGIEEVLVTEMAHLVHRHPAGLRTAGIPKGLLRRMPVDVRVVLNWNMNDTDIDLWVTDPRGERCFYRNPQTVAGGRLSDDFTEGYGPEQFLLKKACKGKYQVQVHYYGDNGAKLAGKTTLLLEIYTRYGGKGEQRKRITLQLNKEEKEGIYVGSFTF